MRTEILIAGQGLAGTMLAWELERAGVSFAIADCGHSTAASSAAAGLINPITGRRLAKSWRFEEFFPVARESYRALESTLGVPLWREMRVRRMFADDGERKVAVDPQRLAALSDFIESTDDQGWWIRCAARVDLAALLAAARARWDAAGQLRSENVAIELERERYSFVIDCRGLAGATAVDFSFVPWEFSKGELLEIKTQGLESDVILNRRTWIVPLAPDGALAGATHEPGVVDGRSTEAGRMTIETATREILGSAWPFRVIGQRAGVRVNLPDKRPVIGWHPMIRRLGLVNGLGAKGALWAPFLARQWAAHLREEAVFDPEMNVMRFAQPGG